MVAAVVVVVVVEVIVVVPAAVVATAGEMTPETAEATEATTGDALMAHRDHVTVSPHPHP